MFPYGNWFVAKEVDGPTLSAALNNGLSGWLGTFSSLGRFPQVGGGLRLAFDPALPEDSRLVAAQLLVEGQWVPLDEYTGKITLLTTDYLGSG